LAALTHLARPFALLAPKLERAFEVTVRDRSGPDLTREIDLHALPTMDLDKTVRRIWLARRL